MPESMTSSQCIEMICKQGCTSVREVINRLEDGQLVDELKHLETKEQDHVLHELKTIMSVYDSKE